MSKHADRAARGRTLRHRARHPNLAIAIAIALLANADDARGRQWIPATGNLVVDGAEQTGTYIPGIHYITALDGSTDPTSTGYGVYVLNGGRFVPVNISITTQGSAAHAAVAHADSTIMLGGRGTILTLGDTAAGLQAEGANAFILAPGYTVETEGSQAHGAAAHNGGQVSFDLGTIATQGAGSMGVRAERASIIVSDSTITTSGNDSHGALADSDGYIELSTSSIRTIGIEARGAWANGGQLNIDNSRVTTTGSQSHGISVTGVGASATVGDSLIETSGDTAAAVHLGDGGIVESTRSTMHAFNHAALIVEGNGRWRLLDRSTAFGDGRLALLIGDASSADIFFDRSIGHGDIVRSSGTARNVDMTLVHSSQWIGSTDIVRDMSIASASTWWLNKASSLGRLDLSDGFIFLSGFSSGASAPLRILGDMAGSGGVVAMHTHLNEGGALTLQDTDRLLVEGDVTTTGQTALHLRAVGSGALTDRNLNGIVESHEGISVVQVGGHSRADAFVLPGGYVAAGVWQYRLHAFGPGSTDSSQSLLDSGTLNWDYRLANAYVCVVDCDGSDGGGGGGGDGGNGGDGGHGDGGKGDDPGTPGGNIIPEGGGRPIIPEGSRPAVVPQVPSYLVAHTALFAYGLGSIDGLHDRLGEIRDNPLGTRGEVFARQTGSRQHHVSDVAPMDFGFGFRQSTQMLQVGGSIVNLTDQTDSLRAGWALDRGTTTVTPHAPDGVSQTRYSAQGFSAWVTWQQHDGWYVDAVVGAQRYRGAVDTDLRGKDIARLRANGRLLSVESGHPFQLGADWSLEPQVQLSWQTLTFQPLRDKDNVVAALGDAQQLTTRLGARLRHTTNGQWIPYARVDIVGSTGGRGHAVFDTPGDDMIFAGGRAGRQLRAGAGLVSNPWANVQLYGEGTWRTAIGSHGFRGWAGNLGIRVSF